MLRTWAPSSWPASLKNCLKLVSGYSLFCRTATRNTTQAEGRVRNHRRQYKDGCILSNATNCEYDEHSQ